MFRIRKLLFLVLCAPLLVAAAADDLPALEPLPEPPPPPAGFEPDPASEPQVTITKRGEETVEEYSINGQPYMQKITPSNGVPYYLVKESIDGGWAPMDGPVESYAMPQWILFRF